MKAGFYGGTVDFDNSGRVDGWSEPRNSESLGLMSGGVGNGLGTRLESGKSQGKWRNLRKGLSKSQVKGILGSPSRIQSSVIFETWYYGSGFNGGTVDFDNSGRVNGWSEPR